MKMKITRNKKGYKNKKRKRIPFFHWKIHARIKTI